VLVVGLWLLHAVVAAAEETPAEGATPLAAPSPPTRSTERGARAPAIDVPALRGTLGELEAGQRAALTSLATEVARLHETVDRLAAIQRTLAEPPVPTPPERLTLGLGALGLGIGGFGIALAIGAAWQRRRARRDRMLRF
jgi:hypothetical protein